MLLRLLGLLALVALLLWYAGQRDGMIRRFLDETVQSVRESVTALQQRIAGAGRRYEEAAGTEGDDQADSTPRDRERGQRSRAVGDGTDATASGDRERRGAAARAQEGARPDIQGLIDEGIVTDRFGERVGSAADDATPRSVQPEAPAPTQPAPPQDGNTEGFASAYREASAKLTRALEFLEGRDGGDR